MEKIEEETGIIIALPNEYEQIIEKGMTRFDQEQTSLS
jgi:hypothetical protein